MPRGGLPELIAAQAARTPDRIAVVDGSTTLTYRQLDERADRLAGALIEAGAAPDGVVGVHLRRGLDTVVALLATWRAGAAYLPLDPEHPGERLRWMIADSGARVVVTASPDDGEGTDLGPVRTVRLGEAVGNAERRPTLSDSLAYVVYTSGSTGRPKGVAVTHAGIGNRVDWTIRTHGLSATDRVLQKTSLNFDAAAWEIFAPLVVGGVVVLAPVGTERDPRAMVRAMAEHDVTVLQVVPSVLRLLVEQPGWTGCGALRLVMSAGEPLHAELCQRLLALADVEIWNTYGPTECSIDVSAHRFDRTQTGGPVPIGRAIQNIDLRVLDEAGAEVEPGAAGELHVGGIGLARGYRGRPGLTAERFVPDAYGKPAERLYRTGDRVRQAADGALEYLGRLDEQVKINGVRVEPAEVAAALMACPPVSGAAVVCRTNARGENRLVAYVVGVAVDGLEALRERLAERLPRALMPAVFVPMDALPVTVNGKLDRAALPEPTEPVAVREYAASRGAFEEAVAGAWAEVLGVERVGRDSDFFELGGHSLLLTRLAYLLGERLDREVMVADLYEATTVAAQAARLAATAASTDTDTDKPIDIAAADAASGRAPLSAGQRRLWFLQRLDPSSTQYTVPIVVELDRPADLAVFTRACQQLVERHSILRTRYEVEGDEPTQVTDATVEVPVRLVDVSADRTADEVFAQAAATDGATSFDLGTGPVLRCLIVPAGPSAARALLTAHHIACDGRSAQILREELRASYTALADGAEPPALPAAIAYADTLAWQQGAPGVHDRQLDYWRRELTGRVPFELPTDRPRPRWWSGRGAIRSFTAAPDAVGQVLELGRSRGATPYVTLLAVVVAALARRTGRDDVITVGTPVSARTRPELADVVGFLVNTVVLRADTAGEPTFVALLDRVRECALTAFAHQDVPFERVVDEVGTERASDRSNPLFQILFELAPEADARAAARFGWHSAKFDLTVRCAIGADGGLVGVLEYATDLFEPTTVDRIGAHVAELFGAIAATPDVRVRELPAMSAAERRLVTEGWNDTAAELVEQTLHSRISATAADPANADRTAVVFEHESLTFAEVDDWSNRIARRLRSTGVGRGDVVAVRLERSLIFLPALLAVLKAGAAYLPLDPGYPADRLAFMVEDAGAVRVLTETDLAGSRTWPSGPLPELASPDDLAYVIYTSGSTGRPKGVANTHRGIGNRLDWMTRRMAPTGQDVVLHKTTAGFDVSVWEIFWGLLVGARTVVARPGGHQDPIYLSTAIEAEGVTIAHFVPSMLANFLDAGDVTGYGSLRQIVCSGEALPVELATRCLSALPGARLDNLYGPTEAAVDVSAYTCDPATLAELSRVPIGAPVANTQLYVLDAAMAPVPVGTPGELYLGGVQLAVGYRGRPGLTAERFGPDPFGAPGARLYRTGDAACWRADGTVEYLGRLDGQVKIRGMRVELGEIEAVLHRHEAVQAAAADLDGQVLVGYLVPAPGAEIDLAELRGRLQRDLPEHMVPSRWLLLDRLPTTASGKLDRRALAAQASHAAPVQTTFAAPDGPVEEWIARLWTELLGVPRPSADDDFFALGGHSLLASQAQLRIKEHFDLELPLRELFETTVLRDLADAITDAVMAEVDLLSDEEVLSATSAER